MLGAQTNVFFNSFFTKTELKCSSYCWCLEENSEVVGIPLHLFLLEIDFPSDEANKRGLEGSASLF